MGALRGRLRSRAATSASDCFVEQVCGANLRGDRLCPNPEPALGLRNSLEGAAERFLVGRRDQKGIEFKVGHCDSASELEKSCLLLRRAARSPEPPQTHRLRAEQQIHR